MLLKSASSSSNIHHNLKYLTNVVIRCYSLLLKDGYNGYKDADIEEKLSSVTGNTTAVTRNCLNLSEF